MAVLAANAEAAGRDWSFGWVRLQAGRPAEEALGALTQLGVRIEGRAGTFFRARLPGNAERLRVIAALPGVVGVGAPPPLAKLPVAFAEEARGKPPHEVVPVFVTLTPAGDTDGEWRSELEGRGAVVGAYDPDTRSYAANVAYGDLEAIAEADFVAFVEPVGIVEANNDSAVPAMGADAYRTYTDADSWAGTAGESVAVGVMDTGLNINHLDIESGRDSVCGANFYASLSEEQDLWVDANGHGTHVTGTVAGSGAAERRYAGMAPAARHIRFAKVLSSRGFGFALAIFGGMDFLSEPSACEAAGWTVDAVKPPIVNMSLSGTRLTWDGREAAGRKLDAVVWNARQLYVVANSNAGRGGFSNYAAAKNSLSVGAAWDTGELAGFSSYGPTADGRLAPLVVGTGVGVVSARGQGNRGGYVSLNGTSMSSPSVAGVAALAMDAQPDLLWRPALARARLMSSAIRPDAWLDAGSAYPSDNTDGPGPLHDGYGLGKVSGTTVVFDRRRRDGWHSGGRYDIRLDEDQYQTVNIWVPSGASRLDVVLTWDELSADVIDNTVLNDLDLWLDAGGDCRGARCGERSSRSRRDNVEWVIVSDPQPGRWRARVVAEGVYGERPRAALAYTVIRGPSTPKLSIVADRETLGPAGEVTLTVSTDGYVAAGTRLAMDCRTADGDPCYLEVATYEELRDDDFPGGSGAVRLGPFLTLGEIQAGRTRTVRLRGLDAAGNASLHFTVTGWNAAADTTVVFAGEVAPNAAFRTPENDDFSDAAELEDAVEGDLLLASTEPGEPSLEPGSERPAASVWYRYTAEAAGPVHFTVTPDPAFRRSERRSWGIGGRKLSDFEMRLDVYRGESVAALRPVAGAPWGASFLAERGTEYVLRVAGEARVAPFTLSWREGGAPDNDAFDAAVVLDGGEGQVTGTNAGATLEPGEFFGALAATVWYSWTAPADGWYEFRNTAGHLKVLAFQDGGSVGDLRLVSGYPEAAIRFPARSGDTYRIAVAAPEAEVAGADFELSWSAVDAGETDNDLVEDAWPLPEETSGRRYVSATQSTTVEPGEPTASGVRTAWWSWTAPESAQYTWRLNSDRLRVTAFKGGKLANLEFVGSNAGATGEFSFTAEAGQPYLLAVGAAPGAATFTDVGAGGYVVWGLTPSNDTWSRAEFLRDAAGTLQSSNRFATADRDERIWDVGHSSLWWFFEAPAAGWYRFWIEDPGSPFTLSAYRAGDVAPGELEMIGSSELGQREGTVVFVQAREAGAQFAVRVGTLSDAEGREFTLRWEESEAPAWLRYAGRTAERYRYDDGDTVEVADFDALAVEESGTVLYAVSPAGLAVFDRSEDDGSLEFVTLWPIVVDDERGDRGDPYLFWDAPRNRLLAFDACSVRSYVPADADAEGVVTSEDVPVTGESACAYGGRRVFSDPTGSFLYLVARQWRIQVYAFDEDGGLTHVQSRRDTRIVDAVPGNGEYVYGVTRGRLVVLEREASGELAEIASVPLPNAQEGIAVSHDGGLAFTWGDGGAAVADVSNPARPVLLDTLGELPRESSWRRPQCRFAAARAASPAADAFCRYGGAHVLEWRNEELALSDAVASWLPNRYNELVPRLGDPRALAVSRDGRHAYVSTPEGILVFERVNNVGDDHGDSREAATAADGLPWSGTGELNWKGDRDVFRIRFDRPGALTVYTTGDTDTFGMLTDANGAVLEQDDDGEAPNFEIRATVDAGVYYVEVRGADDETTGPYTLWIEFVPDPPEVAFTPERPIATDLHEADSVHAADLDGDGDPDVLAASSHDATIAWYENVGGGAFSPQRVLTADAEGAASVHATDLDGDGDADVLSAAREDDRIAWHENLGGGRFSEQRVIADHADGAAGRPAAGHPSEPAAAERSRGAGG
ncbi:MAG: S8 family serine peptidase, partial [Gammaproteobacteria bacterium]|nr:S8 family serine peptidase [Gammaproteobacteria bacterium]